MENLENIVGEETAQHEEVAARQEEVAAQQEEGSRQEEKTYTQQELEQEVNSRLDKILPGKIARKEAKIRKELESQYGELASVMRAGTGKEDLLEIAGDFRKYYTGKGVKIQKAPAISQKDEERLGMHDAEDIISGGMEEVTEESERLAKIGLDKMTPRQRETFRRLAQYRQSSDRAQELAQLGVAESVYKSEAFQNFAAQFNPNVSAKQIHEMWQLTQPKTNIPTMGSMRSRQDTGPKDYYSPEEIDQMSEEELLADPKKWETVRRSMTGRA